MVDCSENGLSRARYRKNSRNSRHLSHAEHKLSEGSSQNMDQFSCHLQLNSEQNVTKHCHSTSQRLGKSACLHSGLPNSKLYASHMSSTSTKASSTVGLTHYSTNTATIATGACLQPQQQEVRHLNQMVSTMNIDDTNLCSLTGFKLNQNPDFNATFRLTDFHPKFSSTPCTRRVINPGIVCHTPLQTIGSKLTTFQHDGHNAANTLPWIADLCTHHLTSAGGGREEGRENRSAIEPLQNTYPDPSTHTHTHLSSSAVVVLEPLLKHALLHTNPQTILRMHPVILPPPAWPQGNTV